MHTYLLNFYVLKITAYTTSGGRMCGLGRIHSNLKHTQVYTWATMCGLICWIVKLAMSRRIRSNVSITPRNTASTSVSLIRLRTVSSRTGAHRRAMMDNTYCEYLMKELNHQNFMKTVSEECLLMYFCYFVWKYACVSTIRWDLFLLVQSSFDLAEYITQKLVSYEFCKK